MRDHIKNQLFPQNLFNRTELVVILERKLFDFDYKMCLYIWKTSRQSPDLNMIKKL